jgi:hypothetical protein
MLNYESRCFAITLQDGDRTWVTKIWATREQHARDIIYLSEEGTTNIAKIEATDEVRTEEYPLFWSSYRKRYI